MAEPASELRRNVTSVRITAVHDGVRSERPDTVATEEPMEIRVGGPGQEAKAVAVTMRTPGGDYELAAGFLFTEGLVAPGRGPTRRVLRRPRRRRAALQRRDRHARPAIRPRPVLHRNFFATSSCGICGKAALDDVEVRCAPVAAGTEVSTSVLVALPDALRAKQRVFDRTGGLHAAGLFTPAGRLITLREDVGRHNAVDKVIGEQLLAGRVPLADHVLQVSGRASFEIVQKAAVAGIPVVSAVSAPSSLAIDAAERLGMTLVGFVRDGRCNVYSHPERVTG